MYDHFKNYFVFILELVKLRGLYGAYDGMWDSHMPAICLDTNTITELAAILDSELMYFKSFEIFSATIFSNIALFTIAIFLN